MKISNNLNLNQALGRMNLSKAKEVELKSNADLDQVSQQEVESAAKVNLSEKVQRMNKIKDLATQNSINDAKIEKLQKMIDADEYKVDAIAVADQLVDEHLLIS